MMPSIAIEAERIFTDGTIRPGALSLAPNGIVDAPTGSVQLRLDESYLVLPGLVNAHDHLEFNSFPPLGRRGTYGDVYEWAAEIREQWDGPTIRACLAISMEDRLRIGGFKNLLSGVTTVVHHNPLHDCFGRGFPVGVFRDYTWSHSLGLDPDARRTFKKTPSEVPWIIHAAEGVNARARSEIDELERYGMLAPNTVLVHALGADEEDQRLLVERGVSVVSCPVSNLFLYGQSLGYTKLPAGLKLALGSDSAASSSSGLLEDIRALRRLTSWSETEIWDSVTTVPGDIFGLSASRGDLVVLQGDDPVLVVRSGNTLFADEMFRECFTDETRRVTVSGRSKLLSKRIAVPEDSIHRAQEWTPFLQGVRFY